MNIYYELESEENGIRHVVQHNVIRSMYATHYDVVTMIKSQRVWAEDSTGIKFIKHRYDAPIKAKVDMEEFIWIKLKSKPI